MSTLISSALSEHTVAREVSSSIILFDTMAVIIWMSVLVYYNKRRAICFALIGFVIYYLVDAILWMTIMKIRWIESAYNRYLIQVWLQLGPGVIHPSFVCMMFEGTFGAKKENEKRELWFLLFLLVQFTPCFMQLQFPGHSTIRVGRTMESQRWIFILVSLLGYLYLVYKNVSVKKLLQIFLICTSVEALFELSLYTSGIRKATLLTIIMDSILEFNVGAAFVVVLWRLFHSEIDRESLDFGPKAFES